MKIAARMIYNGGNCWVLEWTLEGNRYDKYLFMTDDTFTACNKPFEANDKETVYSWDVGAKSILDVANFDTLTDCYLLDEFIAMCDEWQRDPKQLSIKKVMADVRDAHEPTLIGLIKSMADAKQHIDNTIWSEGNDNPTIDDIQIVIDGKTFNIGSFYTDVVSLVWTCLDDIQKFATNEIL